jgi:hypothetical protein
MNGNQPTSSDIPLFIIGTDTVTWRNSIFCWAMSKRGGAHKALNPKPKKDALWINKTQAMMKSELASFESAKRSSGHTPTSSIHVLKTLSKETTEQWSTN